MAAQTLTQVTLAVYNIKNKPAHPHSSSRLHVPAIANRKERII